MVDMVLINNKETKKDVFFSTGMLCDCFILSVEGMMHIQCREKMQIHDYPALNRRNAFKLSL